MVVNLGTRILGQVVVPIWQEFSYLFWLDSNVETLHNETRKLENLTVDNKTKVKAAKDNTEEIMLTVSQWLRDAEKINGEAQNIIQQSDDFPISCVNGWCLNLKSRYVLSRSAKKKSVDIVKLLTEGKFEQVSNPKRPIEIMEPATTTTFESRESIINEIIRNG